MGKKRRYKSVKEMVKHISSPDFRKDFEGAAAYARKMCKLREAVLRAAEDFIVGEQRLEMAVQVLRKFKEKS